MRPFATRHLELVRPTLDDLPALHALMSDPSGWWYEPESRHIEMATTETFVARILDGWEHDGLSYWIARIPALGLAGVGGVRRRAEDGTWNLSYRVRAEAQGRGVATELARAGIEAAHLADRDVPVIAWVLEGNAPSRRVAERAGLTNCGLRVDPADGVARLAYADRELDPPLS